MIQYIKDEMKAKVQEHLPMTLTFEEVKEVLDALNDPFTHPGVQTLAVVQEGGATIEPEAKEPEPEESVELKGPLPEDFPGHAALAEAGIKTYHQARKQRDGEGLTAVPGIGAATAEKIEEALKG